jgi:hypothetical protein
MIDVETVLPVICLEANVMFWWWILTFLYLGFATFTPSPAPARVGNGVVWDV